MEAVLEKLLESPRLSLFQCEIQQVLDAGQIRREHFIETVTDAEKAEFINGKIVVHSTVKLQHNQANHNLLVLFERICTNNETRFGRV